MQLVSDRRRQSKIFEDNNIISFSFCHFFAEKSNQKAAQNPRLNGFSRAGIYSLILGCSLFIFSA
jgi:hypothetical protein